MTEEEVDLEAKLSDVVCLIKFIIILDNNGKIIYSKYYTDKDSPEKQRDFEKQLCYQVKNLNILPGELDIFSYDEFHIFVKIIGEIAYFIGISENDNECLGYIFSVIFSPFFLICTPSAYCLESFDFMVKSCFDFGFIDL